MTGQDSNRLTERYVSPDTGKTYELSLTIEQAEELAQSLMTKSGSIRSVPGRARAAVSQALMNDSAFNLVQFLRDRGVQVDETLQMEHYVLFSNAVPEGPLE